MGNPEDPRHIPRENAILAGAGRRITEDRRLFRVEGATALRKPEWDAGEFIDRRNSSSKVSAEGEVIVMTYYTSKKDPKHLRREKPMKYWDIDHAIRGRAHTKDSTSNMLDVLDRTLDFTEEALKELKIERLTETNFPKLKQKVREKLITEGFIDPETARVLSVKPRRRTAIEQLKLRDLDFKVLARGRELIGRVVLSAADVNLMIDLLETSLADFKAETTFHFLQRNRTEAVHGLNAILNFMNGMEQNLSRERLAMIPIQVEALQKAVRQKLNHKFRPYKETEELVRLLILGELDISALAILFARNANEEKGKENFQALIEFAISLKPIELLARDLAHDENSRIELMERIKAVQGVIKTTLAFSDRNLGRSRKGNPNPKFGNLGQETLPFTT